MQFSAFYHIPAHPLGLNLRLGPGKTVSSVGCRSTGKGLDWGGSFTRPEATGYGAAYFDAGMRRPYSSGRALRSPSAVFFRGGGGKRVAGLCAFQPLAELVAPIEGVGIEHLGPARDRGLHRAPHGLDADEVDDGRHEAHHDDVEDHLPPELLGDARRRDREMGQVLPEVVGLYQLVLGDQDPARGELRRELGVGLLRHHDHDARGGDVGVRDFLVRHDDLGARGAPARLRAEGLDHGRELVVVDGRRPADDVAAQDDTLSAESADFDLCPGHGRPYPL
jgi:hypothetical protein